MWPFRKKPALPLPDDVVFEGVRATYDPRFKTWGFEMAGVSFTFAPRDFPTAAFEWGRAAIQDYERLRDEMEKHVMAQLDGWPCNKEAWCLLSVALDEYPTGGKMNFTFVGDDSWGDYGVSVIVVGGRIVAAYGWD